MKINSKKTLTRKLDKLCSLIIRSRGRCERCGSVKSLQCCHIFSRTYRSLRWSLDNLLCLCAKCHFWCHLNPIGFSQFVENTLGKDKFSQLLESHKEISKFTIEDLELKYKILKEIYEEHSCHS